MPLNDEWWCGAFQPTGHPELMGYRCTRPHGHEGNHEAWVIEEQPATGDLRLELCERQVASWLRRDE